MKHIAEYEAPTLRVLGSVTALTNELCGFDKGHGKPDYTMHVHPNQITNCSS